MHDNDVKHINIFMTWPMLYLYEIEITPTLTMLFYNAD